MLTESKGSSSSSSLYSSLGKRLGLAGKMGEQDNDPRLCAAGRTKRGDKGPCWPYTEQKDTWPGKKDEFQ